jgi:hypothetical protein
MFNAEGHGSLPLINGISLCFFREGFDSKTFNDLVFATFRTIDTESNTPSASSRRRLDLEKFEYD